MKCGKLAKGSTRLEGRGTEASFPLLCKGYLSKRQTTTHSTKNKTPNKCSFKQRTEQTNN